VCLPPPFVPRSNSIASQSQLHKTGTRDTVMGCYDTFLLQPSTANVGRILTVFTTYLFHKSYIPVVSLHGLLPWTVASELLSFYFFLIFRFCAVCYRLSSPSRQLLSARQLTVLYRIVPPINLIRTTFEYYVIGLNDALKF